MAKQRIQKALGDAGILSRRKTEEYIKAGRITVNGRKAEIGHAIDPARDLIALDGKRVEFPRKKENLYIMLHKPRGFVTTTSDELGRRCVTELVEDLEERVYPVGRLDKNTEGLLLITNDGQFANLMMHPRNHVAKTYRVTVRPDITDEQAAQLGAGVDIGEGVKTQPAHVLVLEKAPGRVVIQITVTEGKNRQIRRMCEAVGLEVARLKRTAVGPLKLGMLQPGQWRELKKSEVIALRNAGRPSDASNPQPDDEDFVPSKRRQGGKAGAKAAAVQPRPLRSGGGKPAAKKPGDYQKPGAAKRPVGGKPAGAKPGTKPGTAPRKPRAPK